MDQQGGLPVTTLSDQRSDTRFVKDAARNHDIKLIRSLVENGYAINSDTDTESVVHEVIHDQQGIEGMLDMIKCLYECGADFRSRDDRGVSPIHISQPGMATWSL